MKARVWVAIASALVVWLVVAAIASAVHTHNQAGALDHWRTRGHFYRVIAGEEDASAPTVENKLALDLKPLSRGELSRFQGNSNAYGGITDALGVDPFDGSCGIECGHLTGAVQGNVTRAKSGAVGVVIASDRPSTSGGPSVWTPFVLLLCWFALTAFWLSRPLLRRYRRKDEIRSRYASEYLLTQKLDQSIRALPPHDPQRQRLQALRNDLTGALNERAFGTVTNTESLRRLGDEAELVLSTLEEGNKELL